jgi:hypothetical protein
VTGTYETDLLGNPGEPIERKIPRKDPRNLDYIAWLRKLPLPEGLQFHDVAPRRRSARRPTWSRSGSLIAKVGNGAA